MEHVTYGAVVLAGGSGSRMQSATPKQYLMLDGHPLIYYALRCFQESSVDRIVLVTAAGQEDYCKKEIVERYGFTKVAAVVAGGSERYLSVYAGLQAMGAADYVLIHDGARPCITTDLLERLMQSVVEDRACIAAMPVKDTIKVSDAQQNAVQTPDRRTLWQIQTPQAFALSDIRSAYDKVLSGDDVPQVTDDAQVLELAFGKKSRLIEGSYQNIKVTTPEDLWIAQVFLKKLKNSN